MDIPSDTGTPEGRKAGVLTEERGPLVAVDEVEKVLVLIDRIQVGKEADTCDDPILTHRTTTGWVAGGESGIGQLVRVVPDRAVAGHLVGAILEVAPRHGAEEEVLEDILIIGQHHLTGEVARLGEGLREASSLAQLSLLELFTGARGDEVDPLRLPSLECGVCVDAEVCQPHAEGESVEEVKVARPADVACCRFIERVDQLMGQQVAEVAILVVGAVVGIGIDEALEVSVGRVLTIDEAHAGEVGDEEELVLAVGELECRIEAITTGAAHDTLILAVPQSEAVAGVVIASVDIDVVVLRQPDAKRFGHPVGIDSSGDLLANGGILQLLLVPLLGIVVVKDPGQSLILQLLLRI